MGFDYEWNLIKSGVLVRMLILRNLRPLPLYYHLLALVRLYQVLKSVAYMVELSTLTTVA